ncbi:MAG TPA: YfcE family phosphodiesterase [Anaerolineaceae bacterium]|nr:YfcE family phosphodiesterase [Anaerolineaceae bacterium]
MASFVIGVIADTHIPDRTRRLPTRVTDIFRHAGVQAILHAGDLIHPRVLQELETLAPVYAVRGNRDIYLLHHLPRQRVFTLSELAGEPVPPEADLTIGLIHGHGTLREYLHDKLTHFLRGVPFRRFAQRALDAFPQAQVVVFGHIHYPLNRVIEGRLLFNPGSPTVPIFKDLPPTVGLLYLTPGETPQGEICEL